MNSLITRSMHIWQGCLINIQQYTEAPAEKADFNVWYILKACFPSSSSSHYSSSGEKKQTSDCLIWTFPQLQHISLYGYVNWNMPLSIPNVSSHLCLCQHSVRTSAGQYHSVVLTRAGESLMQLNGHNAVPRWAVSRSLCRGALSLLCRSVVCSHSLWYSVITNGTIVQDSLWPGGEGRVFVATATLKCGISSKECVDGAETYLSLFILSDGRAQQFRHVILHLH